MYAVLGIIAISCLVRVEPFVYDHGPSIVLKFAEPREQTSDKVASDDVVPRRWDITMSPTHWDLQLFGQSDVLSEVKVGADAAFTKCKCRCYSCGACISTRVDCDYFWSRWCHTHCHHMNECVAKLLLHESQFSE